MNLLSRLWKRRFRGVLICKCFLFILAFSNTATWAQNGVTVAGGHGQGDGLNQLSLPAGFIIDAFQSLYIADSGNHRIMLWECNATTGKVFAGGKGAGNANNQLNGPSDVVFDKQSQGVIICDRGNQRVVRWHRDAPQGETLMSGIDCAGIAMDDQHNIYVSNCNAGSVIRFKAGDASGTVVAGGHGQGTGLNQLDHPTFLFVDHSQTLYVADWNNHRVMMWGKGATQGWLMAGGHGAGNGQNQLSHPNGIFVDSQNRVFVSDCYNDRVFHWAAGSPLGNLVVGGHGRGTQANQLWCPAGLAIDQYGNLLIADWENNRIQQYALTSK